MKWNNGVKPEMEGIFMKKLALALVLALVALAVLTVIPAFAIDKEPELFPEYGSSFEDAKPIEVGTYYLRKEVKSFEAWVRFEAKESGVYTFYLHAALGTRQGRFIICNKYGEEYSRSAKAEDILHEYYLEAGKTYYINCHFDVCPQKNVFYGICSPTCHAALGDEYIKTPVTCETRGTVCATCELCQQEVVIREIEPTGHVAGDPVTAVYPGCEKNGVKQVKCTNCDYLLSKETIPAKGHSYGEEYVLNAPTCTIPG